MFVLGCVAAFVLFVLFWGSVVMLGIQDKRLFAIGLITLVGVLVLIWVVAFVYWTVAMLRCRMEWRLKIRAAEDAQDISKKEQYGNNLKEENWSSVLLAASLTWLVIAAYGIGAPIWLVMLCGSWLSEKKETFQKLRRN